MAATRGRAVLATVLALAAAPVTTPAAAADFSDPTWPCIQPKVAALSPGLMWPEPLPEAGSGPHADPDLKPAIDDLASRLALRRVPVEDFPGLIDAFAATNGSDPALMAAVFQRAFTLIDNDRKRLIAGIGEYSAKQIGLSEKIDATRTAMSAEEALDEPDFDKLDTLEEELDWDERIYTDRARSLTYVCETPVILEKRLYAIAKALLAASNR